MRVVLPLIYARSFELVHSKFDDNWSSFILSEIVVPCGLISPSRYCIKYHIPLRGVAPKLDP